MKNKSTPKKDGSENESTLHTFELHVSNIQDELISSDFLGFETTIVDFIQQ